MNPMTRVAVVTGGAGAIGASIAEALGKSGHTALTLDRAGDPPVDLSDEHQVRAAAAASSTSTAAATSWSTRRPRSTGPTWPRWTWSPGGGSRP